MARTVKGPDARRERWKGHREQRRAEFVEATIAAVARKGPDVGMDDVAAEAGVSKPVLYRHFTDKSDLYLAVGQKATELLMDRMGPALVADGPIRGRIAGIVDAYLSVIEENPNLYKFVVKGSFVDRPVEKDLVAEDKNLIATTLARILGDYLRSFDMDSGGAEPWAHALVGMVQNAGDWWLDRQTMSRANLSDYLATLIWHAIDGLLRSAGIQADPGQPLTPLRLVD
ncbi:MULTISPECIES: TetR/AcrR family transcriptional regulator [Lentzea]|uniref:Transcriptional regulator, TetR family n=1 Tax=Lentzea albida TaxID=65499 RepID=A0A1H9CNV8_9PSEU|nr:MULTISPECIES: TetR/AcrR family transcriptional regulator [Lentzea]USX49135.1 TetR/AcrR family transcriptional regulator [Lentzea sp. HUAS12]SEQ02353.1 transcriptional regulator, TetR family [Lentzea albida]